MKISYADLKASGLEFEVQGNLGSIVKVKPGKPEEEFQSRILKLSGLYGWKRAHFRPALTKEGWRTAVSGDGKGFPDLIMIHPVRAIGIVAELKMPGNKPSTEQWAWMDWFSLIMPTYLWYPKHWDEIYAVITGESDANVQIVSGRHHLGENAVGKGHAIRGKRQSGRQKRSRSGC